MPVLELLYGQSRIQTEIPARNLLGILEPRRRSQTQDESMLICKALDRPIGSRRLSELVRHGQRVAIVTSDLTRPCPSERLLPYLLDELSAAGVSESEVTIVLALGLHRPMSPAEMRQAVGIAVYDRVQVVNHDPADVVRVGVTSRGTPVEIARRVMEADARVCIGNLELHYFAGYSGGYKAILPGCASRDTIQANHAMMVAPEAVAGRLAGNPVREDLDEGAAMVGVDFILNVVADASHRVVGAVAGDVVAAHRQGSDLVAEQGIVPISRLADVVLVSAGGYPKDINLYQAQKALDNAAHAVRPGGIIILVADCGEGFGNATFETWFREAHSPADLLDRIQREFVLGGHKAAAIAAVQERASVFLVSSMPEAVVTDCGLEPFPDVQIAVKEALAKTGADARVLVMPEGGSVLPAVIG